MPRFDKGLFEPVIQDADSFENKKQQAFEGSDYVGDGYGSGGGGDDSMGFIGILFFLGMFVLPIVGGIWYFIYVWRARKKAFKDLLWYRDIPMKGNLQQANDMLNAYKYFGRTKFKPDLKPRDYSSLYKIFLGNRKLLKETDKYFAEYIQNTKLKEHLFNYDESDFFVWEMMHGGKCGLDIGVMKGCFDITIPYNNRKLLDLLLRVPLDKRISDRHHLDMKKLMNQELYDMNIRVVNLNETDRRKKVINMYYIINTHLPF